MFHAGTKIGPDQKLVSNGGRVLSVTANAKSMEEARKIAYNAIENIKWPQGFYRKDIGQK